jgi:hypothetical protein
VADAAEVPKDTSEFVCREALRSLSGASPERLRAVRETKRVLDGEVV